MSGKILAKNLLALSVVCSACGLFGFYSGDIEKRTDEARPAYAAISQNTGSQNAEMASAAAESAANNESETSILAEIDTKKQTMTVRRNGEILHVWKISSGRAGYETPGGSYQPQRIHTMWRSKKYGNAPMPYAVFFRDGYAIHGTTALGRLGSRASHGCVRLATENAKVFYQLVSSAGMNNTQIIVRD